MAVWNKDLVLEFLVLLGLEPTLYDPVHPDNKNKKMTDIAWLRIQEGLSVDIPLSELKKKRDSLMASFRYQMRKKREAERCRNKFKSSWFAFDIMYRFLGLIYENASISNVEEDSGPVLEFVDFDALDDNFFYLPQERKPELNEKYEKPLSLPQENKQSKTASKPKAAPKRKKPLDTEHLETRSLPDQVFTDSQNDDDDDDECDLYGKLIAKKLRKLPEAERERLMYEIQGLFTKPR